jgi:hypothetical protein
MHRSSSQDRHARRPALEQCEDRILQTVTVEMVGTKATQPQEMVCTPTASLTSVFYNAMPGHAPGIFDDPFFFDPN